ncbi:MAG TPA: c-type cytochrome biogenesis protein CcmI [Gammaproteobacteria bacterium]|nr:c-type cytochrome biogenesis protein CcmI [Gammaproteobacteria bacterium]
MNITFWVLMILMLLLAIGLLVYPVLKVRQSSAIAYKDSNLKINDEKINELDLDLKEGRIDQVFYKAAREELDRELLIDIPAESKETAALHYSSTGKRHPALALMISIFIPMLALLLYLELGMHAASEEAFAATHAQAGSQTSTQAEGQASVEDMTRQLEAKIEKGGGTVQEWTMLGRAHKYMGNNAQAANAFAVALEKDSNNAQLMLERAEMLALMNNRQFNEESRALVLRANELEPDNANTLWFAGVAEYQAANYREAIDLLVRLLPQAKDEKDVLKSVINIVAKSREALIAAGEKMPELTTLLGIEAMRVDTGTDKVVKPETPASATRLQVTVNVSDAVKQKFDANDTVFVYAKAKQGPRMPLAVQRLTLSALPVTVLLDDSMAMVDGMNLSAFNPLQISARLTKTGSAIAQSGDYIGQQDIDRETGNGKDIALTIVIDNRVP